MVFHPNKWLEFRGKYYSRKPSASKTYLIGSFDKNHKLYIEGAIRYNELPEAVRNHVEASK